MYMKYIHLTPNGTSPRHTGMKAGGRTNDHEAVMTLIHSIRMVRTANDVAP